MLMPLNQGANIYKSKAKGRGQRAKGKAKGKRQRAKGRLLLGVDYFQ
jgi:hypothetical protein